MRRLALTALVVASLSGCSTISSTRNSWFGDDKNKPAALEILSGAPTGRRTIAQLHAPVCGVPGDGEAGVGGGEGVCHSRPVACHGFGPAIGPYFRDQIR